MNAHEVYRIVCGSGGCSPEYFMNRMSVAEARDYVEGVHLKRKEEWERVRLMTKMIVTAMTGEEPEIRFKWDEDEANEEPDDNELEALRQKAERMEKLINRL